MKSETCNAFDAVIFDLDGTIVDSEPLHEQSFHQLFEELGHKDDHGIDFDDYLGTSDEKVWSDFIARFPQEKSLTELLDWRESRYLDMARENNPIFPGAGDLIQALYPHYPMAIASGSRHTVIDAMLDMNDLQPMFRAKVSSQDVENGKPSPDIFLMTADKIGIAPERCIVIEDSVFGVTAAIRAGMRAIAVTNSFPAEKLNHAWEVVDSYSSISELLLHPSVRTI